MKSLLCLTYKFFSVTLLHNDFKMNANDIAIVLRVEMMCNSDTEFAALSSALS